MLDEAILAVQRNIGWIAMLAYVPEAGDPVPGSVLEPKVKGYAPAKGYLDRVN